MYDISDDDMIWI